MLRGRTLTPINAATATVAVGSADDPIDIGRATRVTFQFIRADHTSGNTVYGVQVSNDGTNWIAYTKLIDNVTNNNSQYLTRVETCTLSSATNKVYTMSPEDHFNYIRVYCTETTDGIHTVKVFLQEE